MFWLIMFFFWSNILPEILSQVFLCNSLYFWDSTAPSKYFFPLLCLKYNKIYIINKCKYILFHIALSYFILYCFSVFFQFFNIKFFTLLILLSLVTIISLPVKVELVNIRTIFELTGGKDFKDPEKIESTVVSSMFLMCFNL